MERPGDGTPAATPAAGAARIDPNRARLPNPALPLGERDMSSLPTRILLAALAIGGSRLHATDLPLCRASNLAVCTETRLASPIMWPRGYLPLDQVLQMLARKVRVPASFVIARPLPNIELSGGAIKPSRVLNVLVRTHPAYAWRVDRGVVWFFDVRVMRSPQSPLNGKLNEFVIAGNIGTLSLILRQELYDLPQQPGRGMALAGMVPQIKGGPLPRRVLENVSGSQVLQQVLMTAPTFYSLIIFPRQPPLNHTDTVGALGSWRWVSLDQPVAPPPPPPGPPIRVPPG